MALQTALIRFHTNDDNKDPDTLVSVLVTTPEGGIVANLDPTNLGGELDDGSNSPLTRLEVFDDGITPGELHGCTVEISIDPHGGLGHDTWKFDYLLDFRFADRTHLINRVQGIRLDQSNSDFFAVIP